MNRRVALVAVAIVAVAAGLAGGLLVAGSVLRPGAPAEGSADVGFARSMQVHHAQAVEMAVLVRDRTDDAELRQVALDIELTQQQQQGQMFGWLAVWGLPQAGSSPAMAWMAEHGHDDVGPMPGMATPEELAELRDAQGTAAELLFLDLMVAHHEGGVQMAEAALERATRPEVRRLAQAVVDSQTAEIAVLAELRARLDGDA